MNNNHNYEPPPQNNNDPPMMVRLNGQAPRTIEELCQPYINGQGGPIAPIPIQATDFGLRHHMIQQVQNACQFHRLPSDDANRHIDKFLEITQHMKQNEVSDDALRLSHFPYSLTHGERKTKKDKIRTKPDKNEKRGKAWQCQRPITVKKAEKEENTKFKGPNMQTLKVVLIQEKRQGLIVQFRQSITTRAKTANCLKM
nr:reverse transcriptase domain-containing protein [Tanacetum cinerariifolium]